MTTASPATTPSTVQDDHPHSSSPLARGWRRVLAWGAVYGEAVVVTALAPALVFPNRLTPFVLPLFPLLWLLRWRLRGRLTRRTPLDIPLLLLMLMLMVSLYPSIDLSLSMPKYLGILLGIVSFFTVVNTVTVRGQALALAWLLLALGAAVSLIALVGTDWQTGKFGLFAVTQQLPRLITQVETSQIVTRGFHANEVGGALALFLPLGIALIMGSRPWYLRLFAVLLCLLVAGTLALTQSRSAFMGVAVALAVLAVAYQPRLLLGIPLALAGLGGLLYVVGPQALLVSLFPAQAGLAVSNWASRVEVWQRAWLMVQDFPYTGVGLNTFPKVADLLYPLFSIPDTTNLGHAHNVFLQTAVDLGVPGLLAFLGILAGFFRSLWRAWGCAAGDGAVRWLVLGLGSGVLAHLVFGLTDAVTLGAKPGAALWLMFGLGAALGNLPLPAETREGASPFRTKEGGQGVRSNTL